MEKFALCKVHNGINKNLTKSEKSTLFLKKKT